MAVRTCQFRTECTIFSSDVHVTSIMEWLSPLFQVGLQPGSLSAGYRRSPRQWSIPLKVISRVSQSPSKYFTSSFCCHIPSFLAQWTVLLFLTVFLLKTFFPIFDTVFTFVLFFTFSGSLLKAPASVALLNVQHLSYFAPGEASFDALFF